MPMAELAVRRRITMASGGNSERDRRVVSKEAAMDKHMDVLVQRPDDPKETLTEVWLKDPINNPWSVAQEKARLLGNKYDHRHYVMTVRKEAYVLLPAPAPKIMSDNRPMTDYTNDLEQGLIVFQKIETH